MGIKGLTGLIGDNAPEAIKNDQIQNLFNRKLAIDASMAIYQFVIGIRGTGADLTTESGEITSHLQGLLTRTIRLIENGIKPVYVFDGKPPELKMAELAKRRANQQANEQKVFEADGGEEATKYEKRTFRVTPEQNQDCKKLLELMGVPYFEAPAEAEAQCAQLAKDGVVWAAGSEDMDTLTYQAPVLVRNLTFTQANLASKGLMIIEFDKVLEGMGLTADQFVDLCILCGCDYCGTIRGIGPATALKLIREHGCIEKVVENIDTTKHPLPEPFPYPEIRKLFKAPDVLPLEQVKSKLKWGEVDTEGLVAFLCGDKGFNEERIRSQCARLKSTKAKSMASQNRIDQFFTSAPSSSSTPAKKKVEPPAKKGGPAAKKSKK